jgi:hypothetical protein
MPAGCWSRRPGITANPIGPSRDLQARHAGQPAAVRERADRGNRRLHQRWCRLDARAKRSTISVVAVARELAGWCWSLAVLEGLTDTHSWPVGRHPQRESDPRPTDEQPGCSNR